MSKAFRAYQPEQRLLMPLSLEQWLPEGHLARFLSDVIDELDLREMYASYEEDGRGMAAEREDGFAEAAARGHRWDEDTRARQPV